ncbi:hypothetical protein WH87_16535 [Devosia epidermidihirudinis]|uniref:SH3b domain-containing protein n=1 Tax=Devosia epidermidihirudinis TaxID=1293439 RepID=A0A0F5Q419_9HYPH|nr:peptidase inhibitor family I36 protein [Devosia epidermidihirudinis]KKC35642.1 hypothetical protein WH87_16535 [Devosia epidermidihirudinis]
MRHLLRSLTVLVALVLGGATAQAASESGSAGWTTRAVVLQAGPGVGYASVGQIETDVAIKVLRCQRTWCLIDGPGGRGWTGLSSVSFGKTPHGGLRQPLVSGPVCFYEGPNYTGAAFCPSARVYKDLALHGLDNRFASVKISGSASIAACRDRFFQSYCERIVSSQPQLNRYLYKSLSSIRIY